MITLSLKEAVDPIRGVVNVDSREHWSHWRRNLAQWWYQLLCLLWLPLGALVDSFVGLRIQEDGTHPRS